MENCLCGGLFLGVALVGLLLAGLDCLGVRARYPLVQSASTRQATDKPTVQAFQRLIRRSLGRMDQNRKIATRRALLHHPVSVRSPTLVQRCPMLQLTQLLLHLARQQLVTRRENSVTSRFHATEPAAGDRAVVAGDCACRPSAEARHAAPVIGGAAHQARRANHGVADGARNRCLLPHSCQIESGAALVLALKETSRLYQLHLLQHLAGAPWNFPLPSRRHGPNLPLLQQLLGRFPRLKDVPTRSEKQRAQVGGRHAGLECFQEHTPFTNEIGQVRIRLAGRGSGGLRRRPRRAGC
mmetsp:Transcript_131132/g.298534  ORF Transcript_131132/g.298534 Transcript_131132/m.298534 type:complete len:297 (-) Transcript_131132:352-1242(-)